MIFWLFSKNLLHLHQSNVKVPIEPIYNHIFIRMKITVDLLHKNAQYFNFLIFILISRYIFSTDQQHQPKYQNLNTVLKREHNNYFAILPIPAPQSKTRLGIKFFFAL
jgi:hypothetical protein